MSKRRYEPFNLRFPEYGYEIVYTGLIFDELLVDTRWCATCGKPLGCVVNIKDGEEFCSKECSEYETLE